MLTYIEREHATKHPETASSPPIAWVLGGNAFSVRNKADLVRDVLPLFFRESKFTSFTRKLYRWGFRQISLDNERVLQNKKRRSGQVMEMIYTHENFQRDNKPLMSKMRSVTSTRSRQAKKRKASSDANNNEQGPAQPTDAAVGQPSHAAAQLLTPAQHAVAGMLPMDGRIDGSAVHATVQLNPSLVGNVAGKPGTPAMLPPQLTNVGLGSLDVGLSGAMAAYQQQLSNLLLMNSVMPPGAALANAVVSGNNNNNHLSSLSTLAAAGSGPYVNLLNMSALSQQQTPLMQLSPTAAQNPIATSPLSTLDDNSTVHHQPSETATARQQEVTTEENATDNKQT